MGGVLHWVQWLQHWRRCRQQRRQLAAQGGTGHPISHLARRRTLGRKVLKPRTSSGKPWNRVLTLSITPVVSILRGRQVGQGGRVKKPLAREAARRPPRPLHAPMSRLIEREGALCGGRQGQQPCNSIRRHAGPPGIAATR